MAIVGRFQIFLTTLLISVVDRKNVVSHRNSISSPIKFVPFSILPLQLALYRGSAIFNGLLFMI